MKRSIKYLSVVGILLLTAFLLFQYMLHWSPRAIKSWQNVENSERVTVGMDKSHVVEIMGPPDNSASFKNDAISIIYYYEPPFLASDGIYFMIDVNGKVVKEQQVSLTRGKNELNFELEDQLANGLYTITLSSDNGTGQLKLIKRE